MTPPRPDRIDRWIAELPPRLRWTAGVLRLAAREPGDAIDRALVRARQLAARRQPHSYQYSAEPEWHRRLHERAGFPWPCAATAEFEWLWPEIVQAAQARGLSLGRGTYGGWDDADPGFARAIWCLLAHLRPQKVVETGVARGVTSRVILEALDRSGVGHLWSIDLPAMDPSLHREIGVAVPERLHPRWTYISGTSRRRLPKLLAQIGPIDLFVHDSSHTERNVRFELGEAWAAVEHGAVVADDVHQSAGFASFAGQLAVEDWFVVKADDGHALFGIALKGRTPALSPPEAHLQCQRP